MFTTRRRAYIAAFTTAACFSSIAVAPQLSAGEIVYESRLLPPEVFVLPGPGEFVSLAGDDEYARADGLRQEHASGYVEAFRFVESGSGDATLWTRVNAMHSPEMAFGFYSAQRLRYAKDLRLSKGVDTHPRDRDCGLAKRCIHAELTRDEEPWGFFFIGQIDSHVATLVFGGRPELSWASVDPLIEKLARSCRQITTVAPATQEAVRWGKNQQLGNQAMAQSDMQTAVRRFAASLAIAEKHFSSEPRLVDSLVSLASAHFALADIELAAPVYGESQFHRIDSLNIHALQNLLRALR